jgi:hypothetical protein
MCACLGSLKTRGQILYSDDTKISRVHTVVGGATPVGGVAPIAGVVPAGLAVLSRGVGAGVDGAGGASADELDDEVLPAKELEYVFERHPCISRSTLQAN